MGIECMAPSERARKIVQIVLQRLSESRQSEIAAALGVSEATISRVKNDQIELLARILAQAGLHVVPVEACVVEKKVLESINVLLSTALQKYPNLTYWIQIDDLE